MDSYVGALSQYIKTGDRENHSSHLRGGTQKSTDITVAGLIVETFGDILRPNFGKNPRPP